MKFPPMKGGGTQATETEKIRLIEKIRPIDPIEDPMWTGYFRGVKIEGNVWHPVWV
jgi:hypothetical protein